MNQASLPFRVIAVLAIIAAGLIAAAVAYSPTRPVIWMVAYLVLVAGVVQYVLGVAQAAIAVPVPSPGVVWGQWVLLNLGHAGVVGGTLLGSFWLLVLGTLLYDLAVIWLAVAVRGGAPGMRRTGYWLLTLAMVASSLIGVVLRLFGR